MFIFTGTPFVSASAFSRFTFHCPSLVSSRMYTLSPSFIPLELRRLAYPVRVAINCGPFETLKKGVLATFVVNA